MSVLYHFLASENDFEFVADWFAALGQEVTRRERPDGTWLYFRGMATAPLPEVDKIDQNITPLVWLAGPSIRQGILWTNAEVRFTPTPLRQQFPELNKISVSFSKWLQQFDLVFSRKKADATSEWCHYLEGGIQNWCEHVYALPEAMAALRQERYFVHHHISDPALDRIAKTLRLREYDFATGYPV
jgi:hypothetical protein